MIKDLKLEVLDSWDKIEKNVPHWNDMVLRGSGDALYQSYEWLNAWWQHFERDKNLCFILIRNDHSPVALAPLCIDKTKILGVKTRRLSFLSENISDYTDFIVTEPRQPALALMIRKLLEDKPRWDWAELLHIPTDSPNWQGLMKIVQESNCYHYRQYCSKCPFIKLEGAYEDYFRSLPKKHRDDVKRQEKKLLEMGLLRLLVLEQNHPQLADYFESFWQMRRGRWEIAGRAGWIGFKEIEYKQFYRSLFEALTNGNKVHFSVLLSNEIPIAFHFGFLAGGRLYFYAPTFAHDYRAYSPGKIMIQYLLRHAFEKGIKEFDFLMGEEAYKFSWAKDFREIYNLLLFPRTIRGYLLYKWLGQIKPSLKQQTWLQNLRGRLKKVKEVLGARKAA
jgi:CelD/BcsL family acetyltransferase involved in cellulose biosynthesis